MPNSNGWFPNIDVENPWETRRKVVYEWLMFHIYSFSLGP